MERREDPRLADRCGDAVPVHVRPQIRTDTREDHTNLLAREIIDQVANAACGRVVDIGDRAGIDNDPANR